jgi:hypothetical protein
MCKDCGGTNYCIHKQQKSLCAECSPQNFCIHNKLKSVCAECFGNLICIHNIRKYKCKKCQGKGICIHNKVKYLCRECHPQSYCEHNKFKSNCKECEGNLWCIHQKRKSRCKLCNGSALCLSSWCDKRKTPKYNNHCLNCCINLFPDIQISRNYKTKERTVVESIMNYYPNFTWIYDKKIYDGCSKRRPDLLLDLGEKIIIAEIDENKHDNYDCSCENKRLMEISQDLNHRPIVFIRFNPDGYTNLDNIKIKSCWKLSKSGILTIDNKKLEEWNERILILQKQIQYWIDNKSDKMIEIVELFY